MKVAFPVWNERISPLFDTAAVLRVADVEGGRVVRRQDYPMPRDLPAAKVNLLLGLGVEVLLCGALSPFFARTISASGITLVSWLAGDAEEVLQRFVDGTLTDPRFSLPGFRAGGRRRRRRMGFGRRGGPPGGPPPWAGGPGGGRRSY